MENRLRKHWAEFDRMVRRLGALRLERDDLLSTRGPAPCDHVVETFEQAVAAVCRYGTEMKQPDGHSVGQAWEALERVDAAVQEARGVPAPPDQGDPYRSGA
jgi:hypothetical protein